MKKSYFFVQNNQRKLFFVEMSGQARKKRKLLGLGASVSSLVADESNFKGKHKALTELYFLSSKNKYNGERKDRLNPRGQSVVLKYYGFTVQKVSG